MKSLGHAKGIECTWMQRLVFNGGAKRRAATHNTAHRPHVTAEAILARIFMATVIAAWAVGA